MTGSKDENIFLAGSPGVLPNDSFLKPEGPACERGFPRLLTSVLDYHLSTRPLILLEQEVLGLNTLLTPQGMAGPWGTRVGWGRVDFRIPFSYHLTSESLRLSGGCSTARGG